MKKVFFTLALALTGLFASANNDVKVNQSIELQSSMILSEEKIFASPQISFSSTNGLDHEKLGFRKHLSPDVNFFAIYRSSNQSLMSSLPCI